MNDDDDGEDDIDYNDYDLNKLELDMFTIKNYQSHPTIKAPLSN